MTTRRADLVAGGVAVVLLAVAVVVGYHLNSVGAPIFARAAPVFGTWAPHIGPGTPFAVLIAIAVCAWGPGLAERLPWRRALASGYLAALAWTFALAMIDGWQAGFADKLASRDEYLHEVPGITDIPAMLRGFAARILDYQPDSWTTHVSGHPPGATLVFVWLDRIGLGGGAWAGAVCVAVGAAVVVAVPVTLRALGAPDAARAVLPFLVLFPGAVWVGASADGLFAGVTASGIALVAFGRRWSWLAGGALLGFGVYLSYGLVLLGPLALVVALMSGRWRALGWAVLGALGVVAAFTLAGFWWLDGYHLVIDRYYQGIGLYRPYSYWVWANLACLVLAAGPAVAPGLRRLRGNRLLLLVVGAAVLAVLAATLSGLSKAEVERIWLPFAVWLLPATALLPERDRRGWLAVQAVTALAVNHLLLTNW
ncbi:hypothetical protein GCM10022247_33080 [Allokutzneria multivorans]|uniref:Integral membrane protein n=1 Tax=Allokutzneria multivorans TaxID=1142134 RepID=A0ABP7S8E8_9PSEU